MAKGDRTRKQMIGRIGEDVAVKFLKNRGFSILERNYWQKWGELDIVAEKEDLIHFVEVKSVSCEMFSDFSRETNNERFRPEDNIHDAKIKRLYRTIETYLAEKNEEREWQFDAIIVRLGIKDKKASVDFIENIVL